MTDQELGPPLLARYFHVKRRVEERYGIEDLTAREYLGMMGQVGNHSQDTLVVHRDDGSSLHRVIVRGQPVFVLSGPDSKIVKTAYPKDSPLVRGWVDE